MYLLNGVSLPAGGTLPRCTEPPSENDIPGNMQAMSQVVKIAFANTLKFINAINTVLSHSRVTIYHPWQKTQTGQTRLISESVLQMTINIPRTRMHWRFQTVQEEGPKPETSAVQSTTLNGLYRVALKSASQLPSILEDSNSKDAIWPVFALSSILNVEFTGYSAILQGRTVRSRALNIWHTRYTIWLFLLIG